MSSVRTRIIARAFSTHGGILLICMCVSLCVCGYICPRSESTSDGWDLGADEFELVCGERRRDTTAAYIHVHVPFTTHQPSCQLIIKDLGHCLCSCCKAQRQRLCKAVHWSPATPTSPARKSQNASAHPVGSCTSHLEQHMAPALVGLPRRALDLSWPCMFHTSLRGGPPQNPDAS